MKNIGIFFLILLAFGLRTVHSASPQRPAQRVICFVNHQVPKSYVEVDHIEFLDNMTVFHLYSAKRDGIRLRLSPFTQLRCNFKGGESQTHMLEHAEGISLTQEYSEVQPGEIFKVYFPAMDLEKLKSIDFLEDPSGMRSGLINIHSIQWSVKTNL